MLFPDDIDGTFPSVKQLVDSGYKIVTTVKEAHLYDKGYLFYCVPFVSCSHQFHSTKELLRWKLSFQVQKVSDCFVQVVLQES